MKRMPGAVLALVGFLGGCASATSAPPAPPAPPSGPLYAAVPPAAVPDAAVAPAKTATCEAFKRPGVLRRSAVIQTVDAGLGRWLGNVDVVRQPDKGRFKGWLLRTILSGEPCFILADLRSGDVVVRVNGKSIERPELASDVFEALRGAPGLVIDSIRAGKARAVKILIESD